MICDGIGYVTAIVSLEHVALRQRPICLCADPAPRLQSVVVGGLGFEHPGRGRFHRELILSPGGRSAILSAAFSIPRRARVDAICRGSSAPAPAVAASRTIQRRDGRVRSSQPALLGRVISTKVLAPRLWKSLKVRLPDRAYAIIASAMRFRFSCVSLLGGSLLQACSSAVVMLVIVD